MDERAVPLDDERRNARRIRQLLCRPGALPAAQFHAMPAEDGALDGAGAEYGRTLARHGGDPPTLDVVQLGLGPDGHTASLVTGDPAIPAGRVARVQAHVVADAAAATLLPSVSA